jgi:hypothetical protein
MRIKVIQHSDDRFLNALNITKPKNIEYCKKYNYDYQDYIGDFVPKDITSERRVYWNKPYILKSIIENEDYDWIFYLDADAVFVDFDLDLKRFINFSDIGTEFIVCYVNQQPECRYFNFNFGVFFCKSSNYMNSIMEELIRICEVNNGAIDDQPIFHQLLRTNYKNVAQKTAIFPSIAFNHHGSFIYHAVGLDGVNNTGNEISKLDQLKQIIK